MINIKVVLFINDFDENIKTLLISNGFGYIYHEKSYVKIYDMENILDVNTLLLDLLQELEIYPYSIEINRIYYNNYFNSNEIQTCQFK